LDNFAVLANCIIPCIGGIAIRLGVNPVEIPPPPSLLTRHGPSPGVKENTPAANAAEEGYLQQVNWLDRQILRTRRGVRPVYISVGHRIDLASAERWVPESAHQEVTRYKREIIARGHP